jgi:uracil-DNA glycosylase
MGIVTVLLFLGGFTGNRIYPRIAFPTVSCSDWIDYEGLGMTPFQEHCTKWANGCGATECSFRGTRRVFARGKLPCDVLFLGEAPGESENALGIPFIGIAGKQLDKVVSKAVPSSLRVAFSNMVSCIPREVSGAKAEQPSDEQIKACAPRLQEFVKIADGDETIKLIRMCGCSG